MNTTTYQWKNASNHINTSILAQCPIYSDNDRIMTDHMAFWLDGVIKSIVAFIGVISNIFAGYVLIQPKMKNSFNLCLVALNVIDTVFLVGCILESFKMRYV